MRAHRRKRLESKRRCRYYFNTLTLYEKSDEMLRNDKDAVEIVHVCMEKSGFNRNYRRILEAIEEQIIGDGGAINGDEFECADDYKDIRYDGKVYTSFEIIRDGVVNKNIENDFTQREISLLNEMSIDGAFRVDTDRMNGATHNFTFAMSVPMSLINLASETKIVLLVKLNKILWKECTYEVKAKLIGDGSNGERLKKIATLFALS